MERFCNRCGKLVSGDGIFCPNCGERIDGAVNLDKPSTSSVGTNFTSTPVSSAPSNGGYSTNSNGTYQGQMPNYSQPVYPQPNTQTEMTVGQWVLTIFLSGLGLIGLILLFVWAFSSDTPTTKRNYARAMLIWQAISLGIIIIFYIALFACLGAAGMGMADIFEDMNYAAINNFFIK